MKSIATLIGWIAIGAIITIAGQQVWKQFRTDNPERSEQISKNVKETIHNGAESIKQTAQTVVEKTDPTPKSEAVTPSPEAVTSAPPEPAASPSQGSALPTLGEAKELEPDTAAKTAAETKEEQITERFYRLAEDKPEPSKPAVKSRTESADEYETRQNTLNRQEDVLMDRQMRIIDELVGEK